MPINTNYISDIGRQFDPVGAVSNAFAIKGQQQRLKAGEQGMAMNEQTMKIRQQAIDRFKFQNESDAVEYLEKTADKVTYDNYPAYREHVLELGLNPALMPEGFNSPQEFEQWKVQGQQWLQEYAAKHNLEAFKNQLAMDRQGAKYKSESELEKMKAENALKLQGVKGAQAMKQIEAKAKSDTEGGAGSDKTQKRIDTLRKEVARLATVREQIRKGDKFDQLIQIMGKDAAAAAGIGSSDSMEQALAKIDEYEAWIRKELRKAEFGSTPASKDNPLGLALPGPVQH